MKNNSETLKIRYIELRLVLFRKKQNIEQLYILKFEVANLDE